jgi:tRNA 2-selenouridine synthase
LIKKKVNISDFLSMAVHWPVIDVRSPSEFNSGHIPGAYNIPLFDDKEREIVGIKYKNEGRTQAILQGLALTAPSMVLKLEEGLKLSENKKLLIYCWRGGMRSEAMAWLFSLGDIETEVLEGGYKSYRHYILERLSAKHKMIVIGGLTGSGKTEILRYMKKSGHEVIDLEGLANHKGSAFGSLGQPPQVSSEHFANLLYQEWKEMDNENIIWIEDESKNIGSVFIPDQFYFNIQQAPLIALIMDIKTRIPRLMKEYSIYPEESLRACIMKISKRLGGDKTKESINAIEDGDFGKAIEITLKYYDKTYLFGLKQRSVNNVHYVETDTDNIAINVSKILDVADRIK